MASRIASKAAGSAARKLLDAIRRPAIPEIVERGTAAAPRVLEEALEKGTGIVEHAPEIPFAGRPELREATRATVETPPPTLEDAIQSTKEVLGSFFRADPNLPKDVQQTLYKGRWRADAARGVADQYLRHVYAPLKQNAPEKARLMYDFLITEDEIAQAARSGKSMIREQPITTWLDQLGKLEKAIGGDPEIAEAIGRRRQLWDGIFDDMVKRGWTVPEHYLEAYTPIRKLRGVLTGLASQGGERFNSKLLASMMHRGGQSDLRQTNLLLLEHDLIEDYLRKVAEHEAFLDLVADKTLNLTDNFRPGDPLPKGLRVYRPGAGMLGYLRKAPEGDVMDGMMDELGMPDDMLAPGGYVFPEALARALENYHTGHSVTKFENTFRQAGRQLAKWWTVYNPANTRLNMASDLVLAAHGLPGEAAHPIGLLKWYPKAIKTAYGGAFGKGNSLVTIGDQTVDLWDLVEQEGLAETTLFSQVQNQKISNELMRLMPETQRQNSFILFDAMQRDRLATELSPRIAAGLEAWERTGDIKQFGRVGRQITLTYGAGAPLVSRLPIIRILSPFIQFIGLASGRVFDLLKAPESRNRTIASILAVPTVTWMWNTRNDEFRKVEESLPPYIRDQAHIIVPDPMNPELPRLDVKGRPLVIPFRFSVPEEVMRMAGLGNLASRLARVAQGRNTPKQFAKDVGARAGESLVETLTLTPGFMSEIVTGKTETGKELTAMDKVTRLMPLTRPVVEAAKETEFAGPGEAALRTGLSMVGMRPMNVMRRGENLSDADLVIARAKLMEARSQLRKAILNEGPSAVKRAEKKFNEAVAEMERIVDVVEKEQSNDSR